MIDPRRYARVMGYSHGQATGHSRRAAHRQATGGQATAMQGRFRHAADLASRGAAHTARVGSPSVLIIIIRTLLDLLIL